METVLWCDTASNTTIGCYRQEALPGCHFLVLYDSLLGDDFEARVEPGRVTLHLSRRLTRRFREDGVATIQLLPGFTLKLCAKP